MSINIESAMTRDTEEKLLEDVKFIKDQLPLLKSELHHIGVRVFGNGNREGCLEYKVERNTEEITDLRALELQRYHFRKKVLWTLAYIVVVTTLIGLKLLFSL